MTPSPAPAADALHEGDFRTVLGRLPGGFADLVVTDPPYNIASPYALTHADGRLVTTAQAWGRWDQYTPEAYRALLADLFRLVARALRPGGQVYCWLAARYLSDAIRAGEAAGLRYRAKLVSVKARPQPSATGDNWASAYEECLYFAKGRAWPFHAPAAGRLNVLTPPYERKASGHPTEKRPGMIAPLIQASSNPGHVVLDPFLGSGTTAVVARSLGRRYVGIERDPDYFAMAKQRLRAAH